MLHVGSIEMQSVNSVSRKFTDQGIWAGKELQLLEDEAGLGWRVREWQSTHELESVKSMLAGHLPHPGSHVVVVSGESKGGVQAGVVFKDPQVFLR